MKKQKLYLSTIDENAHKLAKKYGLCLELAEYCTAWNLDRERQQTDALVRRKLEDARACVLHGPYSELFPCAIDPEVRKVAAMRYAQTIEAAQCYGVSKIVIHGGFNNWLYFPCWYEEQSVLFWKEFAAQIPENMTICLENVLEQTPEMLGNIIRQVADPRIRMCLDVGHAHAYSEATAFQWIDACGDLISHFHVHNNDGSRDTHSPLDCGTIPMEPLFETMQKTCPDASITLELMDGASSVRWLLETGILEE